MIPKIIHHTSGVLSWEERHVIARTEKLMPDFKHLLWTDEQNVALLEKHLPQHVDIYRKFKHGVIRVDIARCLYLYDLGGVYCDTDYRFYKPLDPKLLDHTCVLGVEEKNCAGIDGGEKVGNAFMMSEPGFALWPDFVESIFQRAIAGEERVLFLGGPHALSNFLRKHQEYAPQITFLPTLTVYPDFRFLKLTSERDETTIGAHLCWGSWRNKPILMQIKNRGRRVLSALM
jgi:mannosyltransferase OCH1-like enzyme